MPSELHLRQIVRRTNVNVTSARVARRAIAVRTGGLMPRPLDGLVAIAEFGSKVQADVARGELAANGFDAVLSYDPAMNSVATFLASDRTFELLVREEDVEAAVAVLNEVTTELPEELVTEPPR